MKQSQSRLLLIFLVSATFLAASCRKVNGEGPVVSETRAQSAFDAIQYSLQGTLYHVPGPQFSIELRAQRNILEVIETYVSGNAVKIKLRDNTVIRSYEPVEVYVHSPSLSGISLSGSGNVFVQHELTTPHLSMESSGSGNITINSVVTESLDCRISGSGEMRIADGSTGSSRLKISGSGNIDISGVQSDSAETRTSGSGDISLWVNDYLDSEISGSGTVKYKGGPKLKVKISGSGKVIPW
jgi:hypothetical protein